MFLSHESYFIPDKITIRQFEAGSNAHLISSKTLTDNLFKYYTENDRNEMNAEKSLQLYQHNFIFQDILQPLLSGDVSHFAIGFTMGRPNLDLDDLRKNSSYLLALAAKKGMTENQTSKYENIKAMADELIKMIDSEIKQNK